MLGGLLGVLVGIGYAGLMLAGLRTWWVDAVVTPFMQLVVTPQAVLAGFLIGVLASLATIYFTLRRLRKTPAALLMRGRTETPAAVTGKPGGWRAFVSIGMLAMAVTLGMVAPTLPPEPQGGAFFGSGACVLIALLLWVSGRLRTSASKSSAGDGLNINNLASRNLARNPTRSTMTIGLVAAACFLIISISAFRLAPTDEGTGGFELVGQSDQPVFEIPARDDAQVFALRLQDGDDASCRNLYQSARPRLVGITSDFIAGAPSAGEFEWAAVEGEFDDGMSNWNCLTWSNGDEAIPVVLDKNTAMYSMQIYTGVGTEFERDYGSAGVLKFRIVGLLSGSIFQGSLLVPEGAILKHFPRIGGSRYFLVNVDGDATQVTADLEERFSDEGMDLMDTKELLSQLLAVQNTYLSTFQSLGGLGLLLGTFGLAITPDGRRIIAVVTKSLVPFLQLIKR